MEQTPAQEYIDVFTELSPPNQNISELQEDNTVVYDDSSSSEDNEDEEDFLSQKNLFLDPMEEEVTLVESYLSNTHNQLLFQYPYAHFLQTFREGSKVIKSILLQTTRNILKAAAKKQI